MPAKKSDYRVVETIGTGTFGICKLVTRIADGKNLVWKELDYGQMSEREKQMLVSEVNILREFRHPNIVRYYDRIIDRESTKIYILMEHCPGGDLAAKIKQCRRERRYMDEKFVWKIFGQTLRALQECHRREGGAIMHRDLKPANIFLDRHGNAKLGDFGLARVLSNATSFARTFVGTPYYMSPEQLNEMRYNAKSDIWSLGCLLYEMAALVPPFNAANQAQLTTRVNEGRFKKLPSQYSEDLNMIIKLMLQREPSRRPSIDEVLRNPIVAPHVAKPEPIHRRRKSDSHDEHLTPTQTPTQTQTPPPTSATTTTTTTTTTAATNISNIPITLHTPTTATTTTSAATAIIKSALKSRTRDDVLKLKEESLTSREKSLDDRETDLLRRERLLEERERKFNDRFREHTEKIISSADTYYRENKPLTPLNY